MVLILGGGKNLWEVGKAIYIAHAIRKGNPGITAFGEDLSKAIEAAGFKHLRFRGEGYPPEEIAVYDIGCVDASDVLIAILNEASTGMGVEMTRALHTGKQVLGLVVRTLPTENISGLARGLWCVYPNFSVHEVGSPEEVVELLLKGQRPTTVLS